ncbi:MAG: HAD-IC family P-type ATPase, partial [Aliifodinibius sp.]|nr:HAD-IC family P-type ATPase [candidate division Zixibacteria bacterium]NIT60512.1 HAD-IC family P-type ATPase [Fodinibius sp.]NIR66687.1 HAD-IC family P-type ATPase [candidate division Zixibacteria bacterium]NIS48221.1 HAD-IC family P-type ATPase [candidate division Zixibacteria bacterium]NIU16343.1 HAD-IC family P-type ATPase [candidate division Zixibacteria bacterium]
MNHIEEKTAKPWHSSTIEDTLEKLQVRPESGLSDSDVKNRLLKFGKNELIEAKQKTIWSILWAQLTDTMVVILIIAAVISLLIGDLKDFIAILAIVFINAIIGLVQEYRAEQALAALKEMATPIVKVRRNGELQEINSIDLVPGDIFILETGAIIPADGRLVEDVNLRVEEASLTGESVPVEKDKDHLSEEQAPVGDRSNMVYMGTVITYGRGTAVVTATGMETELGKIAEMIQDVGDEQTPLQKRMDRMGKTLAWISLVIVGVVFGLGLLRGEDPAEMFLTSIAIAVAAIPEGLPAVVAIALD